MADELHVKQVMVERLNLLLAAEPSLVSTMLGTYHSVSMVLARTQFVVTGAHEDSPQGLLNLLGMIDGLYGDNEYQIVFDADAGCFRVRDVTDDSFTFITVNTDSETKSLTEAKTNGNKDKNQ